MKHPIKLSHEAVVRLLSFFIAVGLICYFLPGDDRTRFSYEINRPWGYSLLTAPFDIPVRLDSISASRIKDSIDAKFEPVYHRVDTLGAHMLATYAKRLDSTEGLRISYSQKASLLSEIRAIYAKGIVDQATYADILSGKMGSVRMLNNNVTVSVPTAGFRSARSAYAHLDSVFRNPDVHAAIAATRLSELLKPNIVADSVETERFRMELYQSALAPVGVIQQGERIIDRGDIITPQLYTILTTYEELIEEKGNKVVADRFYPLAGRIAFLVLLIGSLYVYLYFYRPDYFSNIRIFTFLMLVITIFTLLAVGLSATFGYGLYMVPLSIVTILVLVFLDSRTAFFTFLVTVLLCTFVSRFPLEFVLVQFIAGLTSLVSLKELSRRSQLIRTAALVFVAYCVTYCAMELMMTGNADKLSWSILGCFGINAVFTSFAYILVFLFEKAFGFTSRVTLVELSDINNPLLRELSEECPGT
ncbi:MAG: hydrolase, partial [Paramuribaculum sp.]|nr:hydrolase [Paramuribaculum sp.]